MNQFKVLGMHCQACEKLIKMELEDLPGVSGINVSFKSAQLSAKLDPALCQPSDVITAIQKLGYKIETI